MATISRAEFAQYLREEVISDLISQQLYQTAKEIELAAQLILDPNQETIDLE